MRRVLAEWRGRIGVAILAVLASAPHGHDPEEPLEVTKRLQLAIAASVHALHIDETPGDDVRVVWRVDLPRARRWVRDEWTHPDSAPLGLAEFRRWRDGGWDAVRLPLVAKPRSLPFCPGCDETPISKTPDRDRWTVGAWLAQDDPEALGDKTSWALCWDGRRWSRLGQRRVTRGLSFTRDTRSWRWLDGQPAWLSPSGRGPRTLTRWDGDDRCQADSVDGVATSLTTPELPEPPVGWWNTHASNPSIQETDGHITAIFSRYTQTREDPRGGPMRWDLHAALLEGGAWRWLPGPVAANASPNPHLIRESHWERVCDSEPVADDAAPSRRPEWPQVANDGARLWIFLRDRALCRWEGDAWQRYPVPVELPYRFSVVARGDLALLYANKQIWLTDAERWLGPIEAPGLDDTKAAVQIGDAGDALVVWAARDGDDHVVRGLSCALDGCEETPELARYTPRRRR